MLFKDQLGRNCPIEIPPERIISLVPSQTELLFDLGLTDRICGITKFCVHPPEFRKIKSIVGGTKNLRIETIRNLQPDLIIANKEENDQQQINLLAAEFPVWISDIKNYADAIEMIGMIGEITSTQKNAGFLIDKINSAREEILRQNFNRLNAIYLIWKDPFMTVGADTFIHDMMTTAGFHNCAGNLHRYPELSIEEMREMKPQVVLLSSEPYPFREKHIAEMRELLPAAEVITVDGEMFSWYGSRMRYAFQYFISLRQMIS